MNQTERRQYLIRALLREQPRYADVSIPTDAAAQRLLLRGLLNVRMPRPTEREFLDVQDAYLQRELAEKGVTDYKSLEPRENGLYLWRGDITTLRCDAIVNAANRQMLGCFCPNHGCIDNAIHTFAGVQLRAACAELMERQGSEEPTGGAKLTPAYNLPCKYVLHTVGPIIAGRLTDRDREQLASCYRACLTLARENGLRSVAFCCISTGEFHFPPEEAARIAVLTVRQYRAPDMAVIFNVFQQRDYDIYQKLLG